MTVSVTPADPRVSRTASRRASPDLLVTGRASVLTPASSWPSIRPIAEQDLPAVAADLPAAPYRTHRDDLEWQAAGAVTELVAWDGPRPVGSGFIHWKGPRDATIARLVAGGTPEIFRLEVVERYRSRGIGTALVRTLEALAQAEGWIRVGLGVGIGNRRATWLYERLGYRMVAGSDYVDRWDYPDARGWRRRVEEPCIFMVKDLGSCQPATGEIGGA